MDNNENTESGPTEVHFGPRRGDLTEAQKARVAASHEVLREIDNTSLEKQFDLYSRDAYPDSEIAIFEEIARVYGLYTGNHVLSLEQKREAYLLLVMRSASDTQFALASDRDYLSREQAEELLALYGQQA